jgi:hypothetical protein
MSMGVRFLSLALMGLLLLLLPNVVTAQSGYAGADPPSIGQPLLREGDFAVKLAQALSLGTSQDEVEAENQLAAAGIAPKNGWIADYPVTPDIIDEIRQSVRDAASSGKIRLGVDSALDRLNDVLAQAGLSVDTQQSAQAENNYVVEPAEPPSYHESTVINNYYQSYGPPPVTYYAPPPSYSYLYSWVPYPFWSVGFWFPGFFILHDFHRVVFFDNRAVLVSNHFRDFRHHKHFRIDPIARIRGHTIAATRVHHARDIRDIRGVRDFRDARGVRDFRDNRGVRDFRDGRGVRDLRDTRGVITGRGSTGERTIIGEPRAQRAQSVRNLNRGPGGPANGRGVAAGNIRSRSDFSGMDPGFRAPSSIPSRRRTMDISRGSSGSGRNAMGISRSVPVGRDSMSFDRGSARVIMRGDGFSGRGARFEGMPSGASRSGQFRNVRSFSTSRSEGAFVPSVSRSSGTSFRGSGVMSLPRGGSSGFSSGISSRSGMSSRGFSGTGGTMGGRGRR